MTVRAVLPDTADEALLERALPIFERYYAEESGVRTEPFPGARAGLMRLRKLRLPLACVTNKPERFTRELLQRTEFAAFFRQTRCPSFSLASGSPSRRKTRASSATR